MVFCLMPTDANNSYKSKSFGSQFEKAGSRDRALTWLPDLSRRTFLGLGGGTLAGKVMGGALVGAYTAFDPISEKINSLATIPPITSKQRKT